MGKSKSFLIFLDPQVVYWGLWVWVGPGAAGVFFGMPWADFGGWLLITALADRPPVLIYTLAWLMDSVRLIIFWQL